jgi:hypothetical protein
MIYVIAYLKIASLKICQNATWRNQQHSKWDLLDHQVCKDPQDLKGHRENKVFPVPKVKEDLKGHRENKVFPVPKVKEDLKGREDLKVNKDPQDLQVNVVVVQAIVKTTTKPKTILLIRIHSIQRST